MFTNFLYIRNSTKGCKRVKAEIDQSMVHSAAVCHRQRHWQMV